MPLDKGIELKVSPNAGLNPLSNNRGKKPTISIFLEGYTSSFLKSENHLKCFNLGYKFQKYSYFKKRIAFVAKA